jgi:hypothetical protein
MKISVTQHHIDNGLRGNCRADPVALALIDAGFKKPWVGPLYIRLNNKEHHTPEVVWRFMEDFDNERTTEPFEFEVEE